MRKTDKKLDNQLRRVLTTVCETALKKSNGFLWLTHLIDYSSFPQSLKVICVFDSNENLADFISKSCRKDLELLIQTQLSEIDINLPKIADHISYDSEENCTDQHNGKWANRLS